MLQLAESLVFIILGIVIIVISLIEDCGVAEIVVGALLTLSGILHAITNKIKKKLK